MILRCEDLSFHRGCSIKYVYSTKPTRTAKAKRKDKNTGRRVKVQPCVALTLRLVVVRLTDTHGKFIGRWTLLTNVSNELTSAEVARWYYWRWGIESFFKLLKGAGHDVEKCLQRSAGALLRRLLIAIAKRLKNDYSQCPDMWQKNTANCYQNNVAWL
ncbi:hypothetical protein [Symbiopectobacterium sp. RP]|uniref:hypothetical protein n=1 Tax=Symbiopectobacterium sp. RP TaxID=3248553 RepID=UPI003D282895